MRVTEASLHEEMLAAAAEVMERQARVTRAEASLAAARRRLDDTLAHLSRVVGAHGESVEQPQARQVEPRSQVSTP
jgi:hypothetical protein